MNKVFSKFSKGSIQAWLPTIAGVIIVLLLGGGILAWQFFSEQSIVPKKTTLNIVQEQDFNDLVIEEDNEQIIYKGIIYKQPFYINDSEISFSLDFDYDSCVFYSVKGSINNVFLDEGNKLRKLSLSEINELKKEEVLSVTVIVQKENALIRNLENFFKPVVFASCYYAMGEISNPEKIIFKKPTKQELTITGKGEGGASGDFWSFEPDEGQGLHVRNYVGADGKEHYKTEVTYPSSYFIKFKNNQDYFKAPINNFVQNFFSIEKITIQGEENCPDFDMPCLIKAETVKVETSLLLQDDKIFKPVASSGTINYVFCQYGPGESCYFWLEDSLATYITNSTKFINGKIQDIKKGQSVKIDGNIECPNLSDILSEENNVNKNFVSCKFFADKIEFREEIPEDETADWKTYQNEQYGFQLEYPLSLKVTSLGPNYAQEQLEEGKTISGTVQPSYNTISFFDKNDEEQFKVEIFHPREKNLSQDEYIYLFGPCDDRFDFTLAETDVIIVNNIEILHREGSISVKDKAVGSRACYYFKNNNKNIIVLSSNDDLMLQDIVSTISLFEVIVEPIKPEEPYVKVLSPNGGETINPGNYYNIQWDSKDIGMLDISLLVYDENKNQLSCYFDNNSFLEVNIAQFKNAVDSKIGYHLASLDQILKDYSFAKLPVYYKIKLKWGEGTSEISDLSDGHFTMAPSPNVKIILVNDEIQLRGGIEPLDWNKRIFTSGDNTILTNASTKFYFDGAETTFEKIKQSYDGMGEDKYCPFGNCPFNSLKGTIQDISSQGKVTVSAEKIFFSGGQ